MSEPAENVTTLRTAKLNRLIEAARTARALHEEALAELVLAREKERVASVAAYDAQSEAEKALRDAIGG